MFRNLDSRVAADILCDDDKNSGSAKNEFDTLTDEDLSPVFDIADITIINQAVGKSFSD